MPIVVAPFAVLLARPVKNWPFLDSDVGWLSFVEEKAQGDYRLPVRGKIPRSEEAVAILRWVPLSG